MVRPGSIATQGDTCACGCRRFLTVRVASAYGSGKFINMLHEHLRGHQKVLTSRVNSKDDVYDSIKTFFGKGH